MEAEQAGVSHPRVFLESARDNESRIVYDDVDVPVYRNSLGGDRMKLTQWGGDIEFEGRGTLLLELGKLWEGPGTGSRDDFISALEQGER